MDGASSLLSFEDAVAVLGPGAKTRAIERAIATMKKWKRRAEFSKNLSLDEPERYINEAWEALAGSATYERTNGKHLKGDPKVYHFSTEEDLYRLLRTAAKLEVRHHLDWIWGNTNWSADNQSKGDEEETDNLEPDHQWSGAIHSVESPGFHEEEVGTAQACKLLVSYLDSELRAGNKKHAENARRIIALQCKYLGDMVRTTQRYAKDGMNHSSRPILDHDAIRSETGLSDREISAAQKLMLRVLQKAGGGFDELIELIESGQFVRTSHNETLFQKKPGGANE